MLHEAQVSHFIRAYKVQVKKLSFKHAVNLGSDLSSFLPKAVNGSIISKFGVILILLNSCQDLQNSNFKKAVGSSKSTNSAGNYPDRNYCAKVKYYNARTGTRSIYTLMIKVKDNAIVEVEWPNGGTLDNDDFSGVAINDTGYSVFTTRKGYHYEVQIVGDSEGCFKDLPSVKRCKGVTKNGLRCRQMTGNTPQLCWQHQIKK